MKIAIIGASGKAGSLILSEALRRGLNVTAIVRDKLKLSVYSIPVIEKNLFDLKKDDLTMFDVVINAFASPLDQVELHLSSTKHLVSILKGTDTRFISMGGAGSLYMDDTHTVQYKDTDKFFDEFKPLGNAMAVALDYLKTIDDLHWLVITPPIEFVHDAERTGKYVIEGEEMTTDSKGRSLISYSDYAVALIDEVLNNKYDRQRISVRY